MKTWSIFEAKEAIISFANCQRKYPFYVKKRICRIVDNSKGLSVISGSIAQYTSLRKANEIKHTGRIVFVIQKQ